MCAPSVSSSKKFDLLIQIQSLNSFRYIDPLRYRRYTHTQSQAGLKRGSLTFFFRTQAFTRNTTTISFTELILLKDHMVFLFPEGNVFLELTLALSSSTPRICPRENPFQDPHFARGQILSRRLDACSRLALISASLVSCTSCSYPIPMRKVFPRGRMATPDDQVNRVCLLETPESILDVD